MANEVGDEFEKVSLTNFDMARFQRNAPAALARRGREFFLEQSVATAERLLMGIVPIVGMVAFGWSAAEMLAFLMVAVWTSFVCDVVKCLVMYSRVRKFTELLNEDSHTWMVANALRENRTQVSKQGKDSEYFAPLWLVMDVVFGGIGSAVVVGLAFDVRPNLLEELLVNKAFVYGTIGFVAFQFLRLAFEMAAHTFGAGRDQPTRVTAGLRGVCLFLMMFVVLMSRDYAGKQGDTLKVVMIVVNSVNILVGVLSLIGLPIMWYQCKWLREYLRKRGEASPTGTAKTEFNNARKGRKQKR